MEYKPEWKGRLKVLANNTVTWDGKTVGKISDRHVKGAKSPGGMVTNTVWFATDLQGHENQNPYLSKTQAIEALLRA